MTKTTDLVNRMQSLKTEYLIDQRKRQESAEQCAKILATITGDKVAMLMPIAPEIQQLQGVTAKDILEHPELVDALNGAITKMTKFLEERINFYEDLL